MLGVSDTDGEFEIVGWVVIIFAMPVSADFSGDGGGNNCLLLINVNAMIFALPVSAAFPGDGSGDNCLLLVNVGAPSIISRSKPSTSCDSPNNSSDVGMFRVLCFNPDASWPELALYHYVGLARFYSG